MTMKVGFLTNHISYGGTEVALYDYAHFNETLLGNTSVVLTRDFRSSNKSIYEKFEQRFQLFYIQTPHCIDNIVNEQKLDRLYIIKSGEPDWFFTTKCKTIVHCVFTTRFSHGSVYCAISDVLNAIHKTNVPVLPHMIHVAQHTDSFRTELGIPQSSVVIGRYGSFDSFDIPFVHSSICSMLDRNPNLVFLAMNTRSFSDHPRIVHFPCTVDNYVKRKFINTCDVMLHARTRGETFGLSCGEFAVCGKPVITFRDSHEKAHIHTLENKALLYWDPKSLEDIVETKRWTSVDMTMNGYMKYTPETVMKIFDTLLQR